MKRLLLMLPIVAHADNMPISVYSGAHSYAQQSQSTTQSTSNKTESQAPGIAAPAVGTSAPCYVGVSGGASVVGLGLSFGNGIEDPGCTLRETARLLHGIGQHAAAVRVMCNDPVAAKALGKEICHDNKEEQ